MEYIKEEEFDSSDEIKKRYYYQLDKGKIIRAIDDFSLFNVIDTRTFAEKLGDENLIKTDLGYFLENIKTELTEDSPVGRDSYTVLEKYYFDFKKRLIKYQNFIKYYKSDSLQQEDCYEYDSNGNIVFVKSYHNCDQYGDEHTEFKHTYIYDKNGNWTEKITSWNIKQEAEGFELNIQEPYKTVREYGDFSKVFKDDYLPDVWNEKPEDDLPF